MKNFNKFFFCVTFFCLLLNAINTNAQTPEWEWAKSADENDDTQPIRSGNGIATDKDGNIIVVGNSKRTTIFANDTIFTKENDGFMVKYGPAGNVMWLKLAIDFDAKDIITDKNGNIIISGIYNYYDMFSIAKYNSNGIGLWGSSSRPNGRFNQESNSIAIDDEGNIYATGFFSSPTVIFGKDTLHFTTSGRGSAYNMFIAKYDTLGKVLWARSFDATVSPLNYGRTSNLAVDPKGNVYVTGAFYNAYITFGSITLFDGNPDVNYSDMFIVKYDTDGNVIWAKSSGSVMQDRAVAISTDNTGNIYIAGHFDSEITFGATTLTHPEPLTLHPFIVKYDSSGTVLWAKSDGEGNCHDLATDENGNFYVTGEYLTSSATFGNVILTNVGGADFYVVKYNSEGVAQWGKSVGGNRYEVSNSLSIDRNANLYVTGSFKSDSVTFGSTTIKDTSGNNFRDIFIAKISNPTDIKEEVDKKYQILFPNPTKSTFHISGIEEGNWNITVYTLIGEKIYESLLKDSQTIDLSGKAKGIYIYQLQKDSKVLKTGKLLLE